MVKVTVWGLLAEPTVTLPKLRLAGLEERSRLTPVADRETVAGELVALLTTDKLPVTLLVVVGAKVTLKVAVWPAVRVKGKEGPLVLKPDPVTVA